MKKKLLSMVMSAGMLFATAETSFAVTHSRQYYQARRAHYVRHKRRVNTAKRVGVGAAGGAAIGALAGGGKGAAIGGIAGAGAGKLYDSHQKNHGHN